MDQETLMVTFNLLYLQGVVNGFLAFQVDDMLEPVVFQITANVLGLIVDVSIPNLEDIEKYVIVFIISSLPHDVTFPAGKITKK